jgi:AAA ATPase domain
VTPPIRRRAGELKVIGALVTELVRGRGGVLVIEGPPGVGKSRLLTEVMALAEKGGVRTLFGEGLRVSADGAVLLAVHGHPARRSPGRGRRRVASAGILGGSALLGGARSGRRDWCGGRRDPLAIVLEDIHWADNGTLLALRSLATARPDMAVLWVLTVRTGAGGPAVQET